mgnify:CR=1 FL=1
MDKQQLEQRIRSGIPITSHMDFRILELTEGSITVQGGGKENVNVHGTAFAGSLYAMTTLALWGMVTSRLPEKATLVMAKAEILYHKPVVGDIVACCEVGKEIMDTFLNKLKTDGRARLEAEVHVPSAQEPAAVFKGVVYSRIERN